MEDLISVIVPVYNVIDYLEKCVASILQQSYKNIELLLIDDGSSDGSSELCDQLAEKDERITVIHKKNGGQSEARNLALDTMRGSYVMFVDSDDFLYGDILAECYRYSKENELDIVCFGFCDDEPVEAKMHYTYNQANIFPVSEAVSRMFRCDGLDSNLWCKLFRARLFDGQRTPVGRVYEDVNSTYKVISKANKVGHLGKCGYIHTSRPLSTTGSCIREKDWDYVELSLEMLEDVKNHYPEHIDDSMVMYRTCIRTLRIKAAKGGKLSKEHSDFLNSEFHKHYKSIIQETRSRKKRIELRLIKLGIYTGIFKTYQTLKAVKNG